MQEEQINLVSQNGDRIGVIGKIAAHETGKLHEAFSIFVFQKDGRLLLQKRNPGKYHSGGLWSNTCCGHPRAGENLQSAAHRRLQEEMGFDCTLKEVFCFTYQVDLDHGFTEHEFDHVFFGVCDSPLSPDPDEVSEYKWVTVSDLKNDIKRRPESYTSWLRIIFAEHTARIEKLAHLSDKV